MLRTKINNSALMLVLAAISFILWGLSEGWKYAILLTIALFIHEGGHVLAMKRVRMSIRGLYFIPLMGAAVVPESAFPSRKAEAFVAVMGPIAGGLLILPCLVAWYYTRDPLWIGSIAWIALINLFNLLPIMPLDGGRIFRSVVFSFPGRWSVLLTWTVIALGVFMAWSMQSGLFWIILLLGGFEIYRESRFMKKARLLTESYQRLKRIFIGVDWENFFQEAREDIVIVYTPLLPSQKELDRICAALKQEIPEVYNAIGPHDHERMTQRELTAHTAALNAKVNEWVHRYGLPIKEEWDLYILSRNPMSIWQAVSTVLVTVGLAFILFLTVLFVALVDPESVKLIGN